MNMQTQTLKRLDKEVREIRADLRRVKSVISWAIQDDEGEYKKSFVKKIKQRIQEKAQHIFTSSGEFLRQVHGGK